MSGLHTYTMNIATAWRQLITSKMIQYHFISSPEWYQDTSSKIHVNPITKKSFEINVNLLKFKTSLISFPFDRKINIYVLTAAVCYSYFALPNVYSSYTDRVCKTLQGRRPNPSLAESPQGNTCKDPLQLNPCNIFEASRMLEWETCYKVCL